MNKFEKWFLNKIIQREVRQGFDHPKRITNLYKMIYDNCKQEFSEDNIATLNSNLREWFENSLKENSLEENSPKENSLKENTNV
jgi:hypothetical protein